MMKISTSTEAIAKKVGLEKALEIIAQAGFDCADVSMFYATDPGNIFGGNDYREQAERIRNKAKELGLELNQSHGPFPDVVNKHDNEYTDETFDKIVKCLEICSTLGIPKIVIHPTTYIKDKEFETKRNLEYYNRMVPFIQKYHVKVAIENMYGHDPMRGYIEANTLSFGHELASFYDKLDARYFTVCLDVGHSSIVGQWPQYAVKEVGHRLGALHIHDTNFVQDCHVLPFNGWINWDKLAKALAEVRYRGEFTFEAGNTFATMPAEFVPRAVKYMADVGRYITAKIEKYLAELN